MRSVTPPSPPPAAAAASHRSDCVAAHILGLGLLATVLVALPAAPSDLDRHQLPKETVVHLATWIAVVVLWLGGARPAPTRRAATIGIAILLGASIVSAALAVNPWLGARAATLTITGVMAFVVARQVARGGAGNILVTWCVAAAVAGVATALAQAYGIDSALFATTRLPGGTFGNRNFMAHFAALGLPLTVWLSLAAARSRHRSLAAAASMLLTAGIVLSRSRDAWIGAFVGAAVLLLVLFAAQARGIVRVSSRRLAFVGGALSLGIACAVLLPNRLAWRSATPYAATLVDIANSREGSGRGRLLQYRNSIKLAARHPLLGVGPGNWPIRYGDVAPPNDPSWTYSDPIPLNPWPSSDWVALISERGLLGLAGALLLGSAILWRGVVGARIGGDRTWAAAALLALMATLTVEGGFDAVLLLPAPLLFAAIAIGALLDRVDGADAYAREAAPLVPRSWAIPALLAVFTIRSALETGACIVAGNGHVLSRLERARRLDPTSFAIRIALAERLPCPAAEADARAALQLAPEWPSAKAAVRRCG